MVRKRAKSDAVQTPFVAQLRDLGVSVQPIHQIGHGCPDILVGWKGQNYLFELKSEKGVATPDEIEWLTKWKGQVALVRTLERILYTIGMK